MEKKIRSELWKMYAMLLFLVGLGIYAHEFVYEGIMAKAALNGSIFVIFGIAAFIAIRHVWNLKNEVLALKALQIDYGQKSRRPLDPYRQPAVVFHEPELLGQGYRLITEEMGKQADLVISNADVQHLLHDVDQRINDRKATIMYFSGLMVFLGLLGAFMGLMKTVHSVGDLIGGMDVSGKGGSDSFGKLIEGMKGPLNGMSVGFSSSLFGLMTSMVLGAFERCMAGAMKALRNEFEHWLSHVAALDGAGHGENAGSGHGTEIGTVFRAIEIGSKQLENLRSTVRSGAQITELTQQAMLEMAQAMTQLSRSVDKVSDPTPMLAPIANVVSELAENQTRMVGQFNGLIAMAERDRATISAMLGRMSAIVDRDAGLNGPQLHHQLDRMLSLQTEMIEHGAAHDTQYTARMRGNAAELATRKGGLAARIGAMFRRGGDGSPALDTPGERARLTRDIAAMMDDQRKLMRHVEQTVGGSVAQIESARARDHDTLARLAARTDEHNARLAALMERLDQAERQRNEGTHNVAEQAGLHGARMELDALHRRLDALSDDAAEQGEDVAATNRASPRATGTDGR